MPQRYFLFIIGDRNAKVESQEIPRVTGKFSLGVQNEADQRLTEFSKRMHWSQQTPFSITQEKTLHMDITRWSVLKSDWLYSLQSKMEKLYIQSAKTRPGADCGSEQFSSIQLLSCVWHFETPWTAAHQASLYITNCQSLPKPMSIESVMPSNHLILLSPSPPALNLSQHQGLFKWVSSSHQVAKVLEFQLQHQSFQWIPRTDLL